MARGAFRRCAAIDGGAPTIQTSSLNLRRTMHTIDIEEAEKHLSELVDEAVSGESFVIARAGKPLVKVEALHPGSSIRRIGFLKGEIAVPDDFDRMGAKEIAAMFGPVRHV
jgi:antitoxin (DNA-binding transcriptional repressor) of toxin-antitoxin stability system